MLKSEKINFLAKKIAPNPLEATYWIDLTADPQGRCWKWFDPESNTWKVLIKGNDHLLSKLQQQVTNLFYQLSLINQDLDNIKLSIDTINKQIEIINDKIESIPDNIQGQITNIQNQITAIINKNDEQDKQIASKFELPEGGTTGQVLKKQSNGSVAWANDEVGEVNIGIATTTEDGLMSSEDKVKLDGITAGADNVQFTSTLSTGTKVGTITINGQGTDIYAPKSEAAGSTVSYTPIVTEGTQLGTITIDGNQNIIYSPTLDPVKLTPISKQISITDFEVTSQSEEHGQFRLKFTVNDITKEWLQKNILQSAQLSVAYTCTELSDIAQFYTQNIDLIGWVAAQAQVAAVVYGTTFAKHAVAFNRTHLADYQINFHQYDDYLTVDIVIYIAKVDLTMLSITEFKSINLSYSYINIAN